MRIPKYQAWHKTLRKMDEVTDLCPWRGLVYVATEQLSWTFAEIELREVTGLKDKRGKDIFEGDILKTERGLFEVFWREDFAGFYIRKSDDSGWIDLISMTGNVTWCEIIGNIYENSELLKREVHL